LHADPRSLVDAAVAPLAAHFDTTMSEPGLSVEDMRRRYAGILAEQGAPARPVTVRDLAVPTRHGKMGARLYSPEAQTPPLLLYMHGGGFMVGDLDSLDVPLHALSHGAGIAILSLDYALAPEHVYPVALEQCQDALLWAAANTRGLGTSDVLALGGDSAGGNLTALLALWARDAGGPAIAWQALINPVLDFVGPEDATTDSHREYARGPILTTEVMTHFNRSYFPDRDAQIAASPLFADDLRTLPPAFIGAAQCDPLRDDSLRYAARLAAACVPVSVRVYPGMVHNFMTMTHVSQVAAGLVDDLITQARIALAP
jgi:acetyl esterase